MLGKSDISTEFWASDKAAWIRTCINVHFRNSTRCIRVLFGGCSPQLPSPTLHRIILCSTVKALDPLQLFIPSKL